MKQEQTNATGRWIYNAAIVEPSGQALQLNGFLVDAPASLVPKWNESLCGQGNCTTKPGGAAFERAGLLRAPLVGHRGAVV